MALGAGEHATRNFSPDWRSNYRIEVRPSDAYKSETHLSEVRGGNYMKTTQVLMITVISAVLVIALVGPAAADRVVGPGSVTTPAFMADGSNGGAQFMLTRWGHHWGGGWHHGWGHYRYRGYYPGYGWSSSYPSYGYYNGSGVSGQYCTWNG